MKNCYLLLTLLLASTGLQAQTGNNVVLITPNSATPGQFNTLVGPGAGSTISTANENVFIGTSAGGATTSGSNNVFIGVRAGGANVSGQGNTMLGHSAGRSSTNANANSFLGGYAGEKTTSGAGNTFVGYYAGNANTMGSSNAFVGSNSGQNNTTGVGNAFLGNLAGSSNTIGGGNVFVGYLSGNQNTSGNFNVLIGSTAGELITTGYRNVMIGTSSNPTLGTIHDAVAIGNGARVALDNAIVLGNPDNASIVVGIGTDSPRFPLDVRGTINLRNNGRIKFAHLSNPLHDGTTDQFLTVDEAGETVLAHYRLKIDSVTQWSDKVFAPSYRLRSLKEVDACIRQQGHLPGIPSAKQVQQQGIDLVKMNALLLEKVEELTLYGIQQRKALRQQRVTWQTLQAKYDQLEKLVRQIASDKNR